MKLGKILKKRKAMTPIMIGIIVAASLLAIIFIVVAATIPIMKNDVHMGVIPTSIRGNDTDGITLIFIVVCDYNDGKLVKVDIEKNNVLFGEANVDFTFERREQRYIQVNSFVATEAAITAGENNGTLLEFQQYIEYNLILHFTDLNGDPKPTTEFLFSFRLPD